MTKGIISMVSGGMVDHFRKIGALDISGVSMKGLFFSVIVFLYLFFFLMTYRLMQIERRDYNFEFDEENSEEYAVLVATESGGESDNSNSEKKKNEAKMDN
ncbi:conserved Plasmodium protein, unknown function [Plasmodium knowlesi strain H]|uniref:Uncharacterized protein n=1 Tax=Plasmodium knowlesi (strain H) TaxID=5851 RepID=A0A1A7VYJ7_PLAKH|nr:conserved Plasmodium protein, unknown function [Plasmodium knowlesi strain H]SBO28249.1 conserved Plasmodium protein, unknown function [Plasmodium knowlesi strain H]